MPAKKGGLGRGLESLFNENATDNSGVVTLKINDIEPNREQPRRAFDETALQELADSIEKHGLLQPILVRPLSNGCYSIIAGERRWRACSMAGLSEVPVVIKETDDKTYMEMALVENLQREDLNVVEEAQGYRALIEKYGLTQEEVAERMGKSRVAVTNTLRLLNLGENELLALKEGKITAGHARALLACEDTEKRAMMLRIAITGASVRELERISASAKPENKKKEVKKNNFYSEVALSLKNELHRKVEIVSTGKGKGKLTIEFYNDEELTEFAKKLAKERE